MANMGFSIRPNPVVRKSSEQGHFEKNIGISSSVMGAITAILLTHSLPIASVAAVSFGYGSTLDSSWGEISRGAGKLGISFYNVSAYVEDTFDVSDNVKEQLDVVVDVIDKMGTRSVWTDLESKLRLKEMATLVKNIEEDDSDVRQKNDESKKRWKIMP